MKTKLKSSLRVLLVLALPPFIPTLAARTGESHASADSRKVLAATDRVLRLGDRVVLLANGAARPVVHPVFLADGGKVAVDGTVTTKSGARFSLKDGEEISREGKRIRNSTPRAIVIDGQTMVLRGTGTRRLETRVRLADGRTVTQDGVIPAGKRDPKELPEGTVLTLAKH